ncbi:radial spoke head protein 3 isoform X2 [Leptinotarsa decemlineata]|uniref:radial spoke head protein 3 isoform X2 n=1 Tax=Leptinotarsa decemlineata TaxID=7539 RepID=UPI003D304B4D
MVNFKIHILMTNIEMPTAPPVSSGDPEEDVAFKVLNQDNLPISVIGEPILKPFDKDSQKLKPNVIVHPTRRVVTNLEENKRKPFAKSSGHLSNNDKNKRKNISSSYGNLYHNGGVKLKIEDLNEDVNKFTKTLDWKLKRLEKEENKQNKKPTPETTTLKKPFVTTVKKGQFLEPPPEIASLIGIKVEDQPYRKKPKETKQLYAFASRPRVLSRTPPKSLHQARCDAAAKTHVKIIGSIVGLSDIDETSNKTRHLHTIEKRSTDFTSHNEQVKEEPAASRVAEARRRALARKRAKNQQIRSSHLTTALSQLFQEKDEKQILKLQELFANRELSDACTQTEDNNEPVSHPNINDVRSSDVQTQIYPGDLFDFDKEVQPVIEILVGKTIEQALIEVLEEEELASLKEQQRKFLEFMSAETAENLRLEKEKKLLKELAEHGGSNLITSA